MMTQVAPASSAALKRATAFFGPVANVCTASWPDGETTLAYPPMKAGIGAACFDRLCIPQVWIRIHIEWSLMR